ncbi:MAG: Nudix family hydrolase [Gammaproteobacteria bacterium]
MKRGTTVHTGDDLVPVVALCLKDGSGRILAQRRPPDRSWAGFWEFPGGKVQPGETSRAALGREIREELGIEIKGVEPLCRRVYRAQGLALSLDFFTARSFKGTPVGVEGQIIEWLFPAELAARPWLPADRPIVTALALGQFCGVTPRLTRSDPDFIEAGFRESLAQGLHFILVRFEAGAGRSVSDQAPLLAWARDRGLVLALEYVHGNPESPVIHLQADQARKLDARPAPDEILLGVSTHNEAEIKRAQVLSADYLFLGHVESTPSHPGQPDLGWDEWTRLAARSECPVYAIGGLGPADLTRARAAGAAGIAGIRAFWKMPDLS